MSFVLLVTLFVFTMSLGEAIRPRLLKVVSSLTDDLMVQIAKEINREGIVSFLQSEETKWGISPLDRIIQEGRVSVDPFGLHTNDINPNTEAEDHLDAVEYLGLLAEKNIQADLLILDMPYSPRQVSEC